MQRLDLLIAEARLDTDNEDVSETTGIQDASFIKWANRAQEHIQSRILEEKPELFQKTMLQDVVAGQEAYQIPRNTFLGTRIEKVEFSSNGRDFEELGLWGAGDRITAGGGGTPMAYIRQSGSILLQPKPTASGQLRYTYQSGVPKLDVRRGTIQAVTLDTGNTITDLTLDSTILTEDDARAIVNQGYLCVVDDEGQILMEAVPVTALDTATGAVTVRAGFSYQTGESVPVGAYVVSGKFASTHSQLPDICEAFITQYMEWKAYKKDSTGTDSAGAKEELDLIEARILAGYKQAEANRGGIPITNPDWT